MILLQLNDLDKYYGADLILSNIKLEIQTNDKVALVGRNGSGKSTLLKIIANKISYESGQIIKPKDVSIGYLAQDTRLDTERTIKEEFLTVFEPLLVMEKRLRELELLMANITEESSNGKSQQILSEYDKLQLQYKDKGGFRYEADIRAIIHGLQFHHYSDDTLVSSLSGGQKMRLALGKFLLTKPDILILDEPTNHLDVETLTWLEQYLQTYDGAVLIVSHDRYFLDSVVNTVFEISNLKLKKFHGNYSKYLEQKAADYERDLKLYEKQQSEVAKLEDFIQRNIARASTTKRAQSRRKQLNRMELMNRPLGDEKSASFGFSIEKTSGNDVLKVKYLSVGYGENIVSKNINFNILKGDSIALIGPNGVGKSTLLKTIASKIDAINGEFKLGTNVSIGYYDQEVAEIKSNKSVLNELWDAFPHVDEKEIRTVLGNFLFSGDDVLKPVSILSGGEKSRLALAKLYMKKANFLILDEPTNHLDLDSKEVLENALIDYPGTILFVSHDRYFINRIASSVVDLSEDGATYYIGDYDYFMMKKSEQEELQSLNEDHNSLLVSEDAKPRLSYEQEKEVKRLERQRLRRIEEIETLIETFEKKLVNNEQLLCEPHIYENHEEVLKINNETEKIEEQLNELLDEWASLSE